MAATRRILRSSGVSTVTANRILDILVVLLCLGTAEGWLAALPSISRNCCRCEHVSMCSEGDKGEPDLFDYFDPLLSPHAYPDGISPDHMVERGQRQSSSSQSDEYALPSSDTDSAPGRQPPTANPSRGNRKVGILLMDHGSRNEASNSRLKRLAELYGTMMSDENVVVVAAHMELANPSIPEGLEILMEQGVDEVVCHPYFLSPGRHVKEDIPRIIQNAIRSLEIEIPVVTTSPVGSNTLLMIGAVHASVTEHSQVLREQKHYKETSEEV